MKNALATRPEHRENGRGGTRTRDLTDVNRYNGNHARDVILLEVESFNN